MTSASVIARRRFDSIAKRAEHAGGVRRAARLRLEVVPAATALIERAHETDARERGEACGELALASGTLPTAPRAHATGPKCWYGRELERYAAFASACSERAASSHVAPIARSARTNRSSEIAGSVPSIFATRD